MGENAHRFLRAATATYLKGQRTRFEGHLDLDIPWDEYTERLRMDGEWAGEPIILLLSELYDVQIIVHILEGESIQHHYGSATAPSTIHLLFSHHNHYDLLLPKSEMEKMSLEGDKEESSSSSSSSSCSSTNSSSSPLADSTTSPADTYSEDDHPEESGVSPLSRQTVEEILFTQVPSSSSDTPTPRREDAVTLTDLLQTHLKNEESCREWMEKIGLLPTSLQCEVCGGVMVRHSASLEHKEGSFFCSKCRKRRTPKSGTIFGHSHLPLHLLVQIMIRWFLNQSTTDIRRETKVSYRTISKVRETMVAFSTQYMLNRSVKIGGAGRVVEVDECLLHRRKHHVGRGKDPGWVLGGVERPRSAGEIPRMFLVACANRKRETLQDHLQRFIEKGTVVVTDSFSSYKGLSRLGYHHYTVNHKVHFVSPHTLAHTQRIEGIWRHVRLSALPLTGCKLSDVGFYLSAYQYRQSRHTIEEFLDDLKTCDIRELDSLKLRRRSLFLRKHTGDDSTQQESHTSTPKRIPNSTQLRLPKACNDIQSRLTLRETQFSSLRQISKQNHTRTVTTRRITPSPPTPVKFDVVDNAAACLAALAGTDKPESQPKASSVPMKRVAHRTLLSAVRTRSSTRTCAGRTPGFYTTKQK